MLKNKSNNRITTKPDLIKQSRFWTTKIAIEVERGWVWSKLQNSRDNLQLKAGEYL